MSFYFRAIRSWRHNCSAIAETSDLGLTSIAEILTRGVPHIPKTVLIVDDDLGFVYWLGHALDAAAYLALPAKSVSDAALLIMQLDLKVDVLLVNTAQIGGSEFINALRRSQNNVKVIGILNDLQPCTRIPGLNAAHTKPTVLDIDARNEWLESVEQVLLNNDLYPSLA